MSSYTVRTDHSGSFSEKWSKPVQVEAENLEEAAIVVVSDYQSTYWSEAWEHGNTTRVLVEYRGISEEFEVVMTMVPSYTINKESK